ncbi:nesprin-1-like isoform X2 [Tubulanus polymorphus]|uniref:nesprin-1-like isoform X2 n=1 Tax=Tubulanus polymorphus TaxID=672921 RepID=UPI003DA5A8DA
MSQKSEKQMDAKIQSAQAPLAKDIRHDSAKVRDQDNVSPLHGDVKSDKISKKSPRTEVDSDEDQLHELNSCWDSLQQQLGEKERELQMALERQEKYQQIVQSVSSDLQDARVRITSIRPDVRQLQQQSFEIEEIFQDIEQLQLEIADVKDASHGLLQDSTQEGQATVNATLLVLREKLSSLEDAAEEKKIELNVLSQSQDRYRQEIAQYNDMVKDLTEQLTEAKVRLAGEPMASMDVDSLEQQLQETKELQGYLSSHQRKLGDFSIHCDRIGELGPPEKFKHMRQQLDNLTSDIQNLFVEANEKEKLLIETIKESEKRQRDLEKYQDEVNNLQKWILETQQVAAASSDKNRNEEQKLKKELESNMADHQNLLKRLSSRGSQILESKPAGNSESENDPSTNWHKLSRQFSEKRTQTVGNKQEFNGGLTRFQPGGQDVSEDKMRNMNSALDDLRSCWEKMEGQVTDTETRLQQSLVFQQQYQDAMIAISEWLDNVEVQLFGRRFYKNIDEQLKDHETLQKEIQHLQNEIQMMTQAAMKVLSGSESHAVIQRTISDLNERLNTLEKQADGKEVTLNERRKLCKSYQDDLQAFQKQLESASRKYDSFTLLSPASPHELLEIQELEEEVKTFEDTLNELTDRGEELMVMDPNFLMPVDLSMLGGIVQQLQRKAYEQKSQKNKAVTVKTQYERMLEEYGEFLETAENKLKADTISANDLDNLKQQLNTHKVFFNDLESHSSTLNSLVEQLDDDVQQRHSLTHNNLIDKTKEIQDKANIRGEQLERLVSQWVEFAERFKYINDWLKQRQQGIPKHTGDTSRDQLKSRIDLYKNIQKSLSDEKSNMYQIVDKGRQLLQCLTCPSLETSLADFADSWVALTNQCAAEHKRLESYLQQVEKFETDFASLSDWVVAAPERLEKLSDLSEDELQNLQQIRNRIVKFLEFRKEAELKKELKSQIMNVGNHLLHSQKSSMPGIQHHIEQFEDRWMRLMFDIPVYEENLLMAQLELLPSRQALTEILIWIESVNNVLNEDSKKYFNSLNEVETLVQKYKGYKIDVSSRQVIVNFVNQTILRTTMKLNQHPTVDSGDKIDLDERLGQMNSQWQKLTSDLSEALKKYEMLRSKWEEYDQGIKIYRQWLQGQLERLKKFRKVGHEVSVKHGLKECMLMDQVLKDKAGELGKLKHLSRSLQQNQKLEDPPIEHVDHAIPEIEQLQNSVRDECIQLQNALQDTLRQWEFYHRALVKVMQTLTEAEYLLNRYSTITGDLNTLRDVVVKIKDGEEKFDLNQGVLNEYLNLANHLIGTSDPVLGLSMQHLQADIKTRWTDVSGRLTHHASMLDQTLVHWNQYDSQFTELKNWVDERAAETAKLLKRKPYADEKPSNLNACRELESVLEEFHGSMLNLGKLSDRLNKNMDNTTVIRITSSETALNQRVINLKHSIGKHAKKLQTDMTRSNKFYDSLASVEVFLLEVAKMIDADEGDFHDQYSLKARREDFKSILSQFTNNQSRLDSLHKQGYRLSLNDSQVERLRHVDEEWHHLLGNATEKYRRLTGNLLEHQDFTQKCEEWLNFLTTTENALTQDVSGSYESLLEQQIIYQVFDSEIYGRQQILQAILSEGEQIIKDVLPEERRKFRHDLDQLEIKWQRVIHNINQRKTIIDQLISRWQSYKNLAEKLCDWLIVSNESLKPFEFSVMPMQELHSLYEYSKIIEKDIAHHEPMYENLHEAANDIIQCSEDAATVTVRESLEKIQQGWLQVIGKLNEHQEQLSAILQLWNDCDSDMDECIAWLKEVRSMITLDLPSQYDSLQKEMQKCLDLESAFEANSEKMGKVGQAQKEMSQVIITEDLTILHQRISLLNKQWQETHNQVANRKQHISDKMYEWTAFSERYKEMVDWLNTMQRKVVCNQEYHIEDLIVRLQKEYQEEIDDMRSNKDDLIAQGQKLKAASGTVRANDIQSKITIVNSRWQKLEDAGGNRQKKLQETLHAINQLEHNMAKLRTWLAYIEHVLSSPITYLHGNKKEIERKLREQQDIQKDIEKHSNGVSSVLNLCEVLLHDNDACPTVVETAALTQAMKSLDKRWHNICDQATKRRLKIEDTWKLWQELFATIKTFEEWLKEVEKISKTPKSTQVDLAVIKDEVRHYEIFQRDLYDKLSQLELLNKQYRHLARESCIDTSSDIKTSVYNMNKRWDALSKFSTAAVHRMRHLLKTREYFDEVSQGLQVWLTEMDIQLTNIEHFSEGTHEAKLQQLQELEVDFNSQSSKISFVDECAVYLMQRCEPSDAVEVDDLLEEFHKCVGSFMKRLTTCKMRLSKKQQSSSVKEHQDDMDLDTEIYLTASADVSPVHVTYKLPVDDASNSPKKSQASKSYSDNLPKLGRRHPAREQASKLQNKMAKVEDYLVELEDMIQKIRQKLASSETIIRAPTPVGPDIENMEQTGYSKLLSGCHADIDQIKLIEQHIRQESGLSEAIGGDSVVQGVVHRWELLEVQASEKDARLSQSQQQWNQFKFDQQSVLVWLNEAEDIQKTQINVLSDISKLETAIKNHRDFLMVLDSKKAIVLSLNLCSKKFLKSNSNDVIQLKETLHQMNLRWERICAKAAQWQKELQVALMQSHEFHQTTHDLLRWLETVENEIRIHERINLDDDHEKLKSTCMVFLDYKRELESSQPRVFSLKDTADQLLVNTDSEDALSAKEKLRVIVNRIKMLLQICKTQIAKLGKVINTEQLIAKHSSLHPTSSVETVCGSMSPTARLEIHKFPSPQLLRLRNRPYSVVSRSFTGSTGVPAVDNPMAFTDDIDQSEVPLLSRVFRTAVPLQMLMLLLLGVACLVPMSEQDYSCMLMNNFQRSFDPMLDWPDGPPPF